MNAAIYLYLISVTSEIRFTIGIFITIGISFLLSSPFVLIAANEFNITDKIKDKIFYCIKTLGITIFILTFIECFIPSEKTMYLMIGANYLEKSGIPTKVEQVINKKLNEYLLEEVKK